MLSTGGKNTTGRDRESQSFSRPTLQHTEALVFATGASAHSRFQPLTSHLLGLFYCSSSVYYVGVDLSVRQRCDFE